MPLIFMCFPAPYARSASHTQTAPSISSPHPSARLSPYAGAVLPYVFTASPHSHQASKIPTLVSARPAFPAPQIRHPQVSTNSLRRLLVRYHMSRRGTNPPRPAAGPLKCASDQLTQIHCADEGAWARHRFAMRRRRRSGGLHSSPPEGGQLRGVTCVPFPGACRTVASGLR